MLITGVAGILGAAAVSRLEADPEIDLLIGVDSSSPTGSGRAEFLHADLRRDLLGRVIRAAGIDTVVHLGVLHDELAVRPRSAHESSILGTVNLLAACSEADTAVRHLVVRSSAVVYGCAPADPSIRLESENLPDLEDPTGRDAGEVESYTREYAVRRPGASVVLLRFGEIVAADSGTWMTRLLTAPAIPAVLGFDPRLQLLALDDAASAVAAASAPGIRGCHNVAGEGVVLLSQAAAILGRRLFPLLPPLGAAPAVGALKQLTGLDLSGQRLDLLRHGRVLATRSAGRQLGLRPRTTRAALEALAAGAARPHPPFADLDEVELEALLRAKGRPAGRR
ncbi:MAG: NAD-dependent epimerase/dehydratase family protein [Candidatus Dormibacteria bacterium]